MVSLTLRFGGQSGCEMDRRQPFLTLAVAIELSEDELEAVGQGPGVGVADS